MFCVMSGISLRESFDVLSGVTLREMFGVMSGVRYHLTRVEFQTLTQKSLIVYKNLFENNEFVHTMFRISSIDN